MRRGFSPGGLLGLVLLVMLFAGCDRAAELIPGHGTTPTPKAHGTPAPVAAPPLLAPGSLRLAGSAAGGDRPTIADTELGRALVLVQAYDDANPPRAVRSGAGVVVDRGQNLVLTSYALVQAYRSNGSRAYAQLLVGPAAGGGNVPEYTAEVVSANPQSDVAVLRLTGLRPNVPAPAPFGEAVLADTSTLRRGDRVRLLTQPSLERSGPIVITNGSLVGFAGDGNDARAWLKTDIRQAGTALGAPAFDQAGSLIGIGSMLAYDPAATVALVRPLAKALEIIEQAKHDPNQRYQPPLQRLPATSAAEAPGADGVMISRPVFAQNAQEGPGFRDLFDYTSIFKAGTADVDYEFIVQGLAQGSLVQELWYLNGVLQDALSSSYTWNQGPLGIVTDRLSATRGIPTGVWTFEVWVSGAVRASSTVYIGTTPPEASATPTGPRRPEFTSFRFAATATPEGLPGEEASAGSGQLLLFFDFRNAAALRTVRWIATRDGRQVYQSQAQPWLGGNNGVWWVGVLGENGRIGAGNWEFQFYADSFIAGTARVTVR